MDIRTTGKEYAVEFNLGGDVNFEYFETIEEAKATIKREVETGPADVQYTEIHLWRRCKLKFEITKARKKSLTVPIEAELSEMNEIPCATCGGRISPDYVKCPWCGNDC